MPPNERNGGPEGTTPRESTTNTISYQKASGRDDDTAIDPSMRDILLANAVEYAEHHWRIFPLAIGDKIPRIPSPHPPRTPERATCRGECGKHGHGVRDATEDVETVIRWWGGQYPRSNIGCQIPESMLLLDIDPRHGGDVTWAEYENTHGNFPEGQMTISGRGDGGRHLWMRRPAGKIQSTRLGPGLDLKTSTGYVVMPPSIHPDSGKPYVRVEGPIVAPPQWFIDLVTAPTPAQRPPLGVSRHFFGTSIADAFCDSVSWAEILEPHGWVCRDYDSDEDGSRWLHPESTSACSATICNGCLFVYSTNTAFEATESGNPKGYTKFRAYAVLNHEGNLKTAARAIRKGAVK